MKYVIYTLSDGICQDQCPTKTLIGQFQERFKKGGNCLSYTKE